MRFKQIDDDSSSKFFPRIKTDLSRGEKSRVGVTKKVTGIKHKNLKNFEEALYFYICMNFLSSIRRVEKKKKKVVRERVLKFIYFSEDGKRREERTKRELLKLFIEDKFLFPE